MKRSDVRVWLHQAALDVARLAEPRPAGRQEQQARLTYAAHESLVEAELHARRHVTSTDVAHTVVEVRGEDDPPGIEATLVVCPERAVDHVPLGREVILPADLAALRAEATEGAIHDALRLAHRALRSIDQGQVQAMHDLLRDLRRALRDARVHVTGPDRGAAPPSSGALTTQLGGAS